ncbi:dipeptidase [Bradyrhizobium manausense]|uniref:dipeptidase n=1 Tax=Bradyrhizobium TaxID=374 RepID=UPI001BACA033|nr:MULTISPECIES: dipeptidase [Bradyrhizobium]MBR0829199.1 dipeptidase [Bradyrhizobium manausense]UVO29868.1 dipeptidase [Bradyrhizobium arachidis]
MKRIFLSLLALSLAQGAFAETVKKPEIDKLAIAEQAKVSPSFPAFLAEAAKAYPKLKASVAAYEKMTPLAGDDLINIARLLGLYNRLHNQQAVISAIEAMVALPTVRSDSIPPYESKPMIDFGLLVEAMAKNFDLQYRNVDNRIFEVTLPGKGREEFGILTHADVVPVTPEEWVLEDGTRLDPFKLTRVGGYLYGRGTIDDKGSVAAVLYAMKAVKESRLPVERTIRLMIETTEETGGDGMKYYRDKTSLPEYNIVLDSKYPAVVAEKGSGALKAFFPVEAANDKRTIITAMAGAAAANTIPQIATASLKGSDLAQTLAKLNAAKTAFVTKYESGGGKFAIDIVKGADSVQVKVTGTSAHGSRPEEGVNPLPRLTLFLQEAGVAFADNHYAKAVKYLNDLFGTGYLGDRMGVGYKDGFMGALTMSPNFIAERDGKLEVTANVRMPRGNTPEKLTQVITGKINAWAAVNKAKVDIDYQQGNWMARDPKGAWLATLLNIFGDTTGLEAKPVPTAGSTTAKLMPNAINFGPAMPGKKYTAHNANEFKEVADLDTDMQMFTEMLVRIGNLKQMQ